MAMTRRSESSEMRPRVLRRRERSLTLCSRIWYFRIVMVKLKCCKYIYPTAAGPCLLTHALKACAKGSRHQVGMGAAPFRGRVHPVLISCHTLPSTRSAVVALRSSVSSPYWLLLSWQPHCDCYRDCLTDNASPAHMSLPSLSFTLLRYLP